jgi:hypothetical protein
MNRKQKWLTALALAAAGVGISFYIAARELGKRFEPFLRAQAIDYLSKRFDSHVELAMLHVRLTGTSPVRMLLTRGRGGIARVEGAGIELRHRDRQDVPPMLVIRKFAFDVDMASLVDGRPRVRIVTLDGVDVNVPPAGQRPSQPEGGGGPSAVIEKVLIRDAKLAILPADRTKVPLRFDIHSLALTSSGPGMPMRYEATLTNPKPPGAIRSSGTFGPWVAGEPGNTPIAGEYDFQKADLGVFPSIAGILNSQGRFEGTLDSLHAHGEATVTDFRLKRAGNAVPLRTRFEVQVDGTNGNTHLQPVQVTLGSTHFTTSGAVIRHEGDRRRSIGLEVAMPHGNLRDILRLAMKGAPFMEGRLALHTKIDIPPLSGSVSEKLKLDGRFEVSDAKFLQSRIQDKLDELSRKGQGQPKNEAIDEVVSGMAGSFRLEDQVISFRSLAFRVPGADVELAGSYDMGADAIDFHGALKLDAKVSQTQTGWKHWVLKPVDPFFAKNGAGTFLKIKVDGNSGEPKFGLDRRKNVADN